MNIKLFAGHLFAKHFVLDLPSPDFLSSEIKPLRLKFFKICQTCPTNLADFEYSVYKLVLSTTCTMLSAVVLREQSGVFAFVSNNVLIPNGLQF